MGVGQVEETRGVGVPPLVARVHTRGCTIGGRFLIENLKGKTQTGCSDQSCAVSARCLVSFLPFNSTRAGLQCTDKRTTPRCACRRIPFFSHLKEWEPHD